MLMKQLPLALHLRRSRSSSRLLGWYPDLVIINNRVRNGTVWELIKSDLLRLVLNARIPSLLRRCQALLLGSQVSILSGFLHLGEVALLLLEGRCLLLHELSCSNGITCPAFSQGLPLLKLGLVGTQEASIIVTFIPTDIILFFFSSCLWFLKSNLFLIVSSWRLHISPEVTSMELLFVVEAHRVFGTVRILFNSEGRWSVAYGREVEGGILISISKI
mmetsp:Transcript_22986/g.35495  ORF Transcript_22986/g.35495 Transcript_22986/m.35495 type:complete len:218 (-) Transcript_22986:2477-3130(-)